MTVNKNSAKETEITVQLKLRQQENVKIPT